MKQRGILSKLFSFSRSLIFIVIVAFSANVFIAQAQTIDGSLTGIVSDEQGAALAGATVTITSVERNSVAATLQTNEDGEYTVISLIPGLYVVAVEKSGFSRMETRDVKIDIAQRARLDVSLSASRQTTLSRNQLTTVRAFSTSRSRTRSTAAIFRLLIVGSTAHSRLLTARTI